VSENEITPSNGEQMMNCPKCGFEQPVDQYCAKCGVDMAKTLKKSSGLKGMFKNPAVIAGFVILLGGIGYAGYRSSAQNSENAFVESNSVGSDSDARTKSRLSAKASNSVAENLKAAENSNAQAVVADRDEGQAYKSQNDASLTIQPTPQAPPLAFRKAGRTAALATGVPQASPSATTNPGLLVVFAWAEVSKEWLQALGATEPGFHQIPGLETKLRQSAGSFRIIDVTRRRLTDDAEPVVITKADQTVFFEPISVRSKAITGGFTAQFKSAHGEIRAPATTTASLLKGTGAIVPMGPSISSQGTENVVFILPRWEND
jgi:hypothetical protein